MHKTVKEHGRLPSADRGTSPRGITVGREGFCKRIKRLISLMPLLVCTRATRKKEAQTLARYDQVMPYRRNSNRSGSANLTLAITSSHGVPCRHGTTAYLPTRHLGTNTPLSPSLYSGAGNTCGNIGGRRTGVTG